MGLMIEFRREKITQMTLGDVNTITTKIEALLENVGREGENNNWQEAERSARQLQKILKEVSEERPSAEKEISRLIQAIQRRDKSQTMNTQRDLMDRMLWEVNIPSEN